MFVATPRYTRLSPRFIGKTDKARCIWDGFGFSGFPYLPTTSTTKQYMKSRVAWSLGRTVKTLHRRWSNRDSRINVDLHKLVSIFGLQECIWPLRLQTFEGGNAFGESPVNRYAGLVIDFMYFASAAASVGMLWHRRGLCSMPSSRNDSAALGTE